ncbi:MAG TPA: YtxH domain-containing protein [Candidatus Sulfotelmatobacter sp.]|jgi:gas vesicle protein|nr:YtxH domain-containing protein [Candidatus Sulfotelmatobacter sp.]
MSDDRGSSGGTLLLAFLAGAAAGVVLALLTAPKSGREMRDSIRGWAKDKAGSARGARAVRAARRAFDEIVGDDGTTAG